MRAILWEMGTLRPGAETTVMMELMPVEEGDIGSIATVTFEAAASARTLVTRPQLTLEHTTTREVLVGEEVVFNIKLSNPGTGAATNVFIEENVPTGLQHFNGSELEYQIGTIRPGESRMLELTLKADQAGLVRNVLHARADGNVAVEDSCELEVVSPELRVRLRDPIGGSGPPSELRNSCGESWYCRSPQCRTGSPPAPGSEVYQREQFR